VKITPHKKMISAIMYYVKVSLTTLLLLIACPYLSYSSTQLGEILIKVVQVKKPDGYWEWYVKHNQDIKKFNREFTETRIQLAHLASEISRAKAMRFNLARMRMEWNMAKDESINFAGFNLGRYFTSAIHQTARVGPKAIASNKNKSIQSGNDIRSWIQSQKTLINKTTKFHSDIYSRAQAQLSISGQQRPALTSEVTRLKDENKLLPLFLYDYAAWYEPDQLPALIKTIVAKGSLDRNLKNLLLAKAKIADADNLEKKAFAERLRPTQENNQRISVNLNAVKKLTSFTLSCMAGDPFGYYTSFDDIVPDLGAIDTGIDFRQETLVGMAAISRDPIGYLDGRTPMKKILKTVTIADVYQITSQTQRLRAIALLRDNLAINKNDSQAKALLIQQELYWLKRIAQKIEIQSTMTMNAFAAYLSNRGLDPVLKEGWWPGIKDTVSIIWGLGPISLFAGIPGIDLPGANAELVGKQQMESARNRIAFSVLMRLVKAGNTLTEIKALDKKELASVLKKYWGYDAQSSPNRIRSINKFAVDIYMLMRDLKDLDRLSTDDRFEFARDVNEFFAKDYFDPVNSRYHWYESFGDLLNVHNIITLWGPGAIVKIGGKWAKAPYMSWAQQTQLQNAGQSLSGLGQAALGRVLSSQKVLIKGYNLDTIGHMIKDTQSIKLLTKANAFTSSVMSKGGGYAAIAKLVATFYINGAMTEIAQSTGIPGMALITELLLSYEVPHGMVNNLVTKSSGYPLKGLIKPLKNYQNRIKKTKNLLLRTSTSIDETSSLITRVVRESRSGKKTVTAATAQQIDSLGEAIHGRRVQELNTVAAELNVPSVKTRTPYKGTTVQTKLPDTGVTVQTQGSGKTFQVLPDYIPHSTAQASDDALINAVHALDSGDFEEASQAIAAGRTLVAVAKKDADIISKRVSKAVDKLESAAPSSLPSAQSLDDELADIINKSIGDRDEVASFIHKDIYNQGVAGEKMRLADEALRRGDFETALAHLDDAKRYAREMDESTEALASLINSRKTLLAHARDAKGFILQRRGESHHYPAFDPIDNNELDQILIKLKNGDFKGTVSGKNIAIEVTVGGKKFRIKPKQIEAQAEAEAVGGAIADLLGFDTPASNILDAKGIVVNIKGKNPINLENILVTRNIEQFIPINELEESVLLALRSDYAEQRALRAFLADSDGHLGNIGLGPNGKLWVIDTDLANFGNDHTLRQLNSTAFKNEAELMEAAVTYAHARMPKGSKGDIEYSAALDRMIKNHPLYRWIGRADQMIQYQDMAGLVDKIRNMVSSKTSLVEKLIKRGIKRERAEQIYKVLKQRSDILEDVLNKPSLFGGDAIELGFILHLFPQLLEPIPIAGSPFEKSVVWPRVA